MEELAEPHGVHRANGLLLVGSGFLLFLSVLFAVALQRTGTLTIGFALTYLVLCALAVFAWQKQRRDEDLGHTLLACLAAFLFFPVGLIFTAGWLFWHTLSPPPPEGQGEIGEEDMKVFKLPRKLWSFGEEQEELFVPAVSLLERGDIEERRAAIEVLAQIGGPEQVRHLQSCLDDPEREVYQFAHAKLTELHERHTDAIRAAEAGEKRQELLDSYLLYMRSGLLGEATQEFYRQKAVRTAVSLLKELPDSVPLLNLLGQLYLEQGAEQEARLLLEKALELEPESLEARYGLAQIAYSQQDFESLRNYLKPLRKVVLTQQNVRSEILEAVIWWLDGSDD